MCTRGVCVCVGIQGCVIQVDVTLGMDCGYSVFFCGIQMGVSLGGNLGKFLNVEGYIIGWGYKQMCYSMDGGLLWFCGIQMCALG